MSHRLAWSAIVALLIGIIALAAGWTGAEQAFNLRGPPSETAYCLECLHNAIVAYQGSEGGYPRQLDDLSTWLDTRPALNPGFASDGTCHDGWDHPIAYVGGPTSFQATSFGRDGRPGGDGLDADTTIDVIHGPRPADTKLTLSQFLEKGRCRILLIWAAISALVAGVLCFAGTRRADPARPAWQSILITGLVTALAAGITSSVIAALDLFKCH